MSIFSSNGDVNQTRVRQPSGGRSSIDIFGQKPQQQQQQRSHSQNQSNIFSQNQPAPPQQTSSRSNSIAQQSENRNNFSLGHQDNAPLQHHQQQHQQQYQQQQQPQHYAGQQPNSTNQFSPHNQNQFAQSQETYGIGRGRGDSRSNRSSFDLGGHQEVDPRLLQQSQQSSRKNMSQLGSHNEGFISNEMEPPISSRAHVQAPARGEVAPHSSSHDQFHNQRNRSSLFEDSSVAGTSQPVVAPVVVENVERVAPRTSVRVRQPSGGRSSITFG